VNPADLGRSAEDKAADYLRSLGYRIVDRRWACPLGELDIIAYDEDSLVFVEVRARTGVGYGSPAETVTRVKQAKLIKTAITYIKAKALRPGTVRFDVIGFAAAGGPEHIVNAFQTSGYTF